MVSNNPDLTNIFPYRRKYFKSLSLFNRIKEEFSYFKNIISGKYDLIINLTEGERGSYIALFSPKAKKLGYNLSNGFLKKLKPFDKLLTKDVTTHIARNDVNFIKLLDKEINSINVNIHWAKKDEEKVNKILEDNKISEFIQVHPVSRWMFKCWDDACFANIIDYIQNEKKLKVILTASKDKIEVDRINKIIALCKTKPLNLTGELSLKELAYLSKITKLFVGIDSAPMHMAAAVDTPVIALFGASMPNLWGPWDNESNIDYQLINGIQKIGKHKIVGSTNMELFYEDDIKKSRGMLSIKLEDIKGLIDESV